MDKDRDVVIVGGGAAGLSAALMLGRARRRTVVVDSGLPRNRFAAHMHGVLGHEGADPADLLRRGRSEVESYGVTIRSGMVERVEALPREVRVHLDDGSVLAARALVVASGLVDELPPIPGLAERWGTTVLHCPYCHGWEVRDQRLGVIVTSPLGTHQAQLVRQWSENLTVFADDALLAPQTADRLRARDVRIVTAPVVELLGEGDRLMAARTSTGEVVELDAVFVAAVAHPSDGFLDGLDLRRTSNPMGEFLDVDDMGRTSNPRIWAAGNVTNPGANVPISVAAGALVGGTVNLALVEEDFDAATDGLGC